MDSELIKSKTLKNLKNIKAIKIDFMSVDFNECVNS